VNSFLSVRRILVLVSLVITGSAVITSSALATRAEERQGAVLMRDFQAREPPCASLTAEQFELIGEYLMSRIIGSPAAHDAMNARMKQMMGPGGEAQAHIFLAQRNTGCINGARPPASFGQMMGVVGSYRGSGGMGPGMMGGNAGAGSTMGHPNNAGSRMMGGNQLTKTGGAHNDGGWSTGVAVLVGLLGGALLAVLLRTLRSRPANC
jgi:hypothetical protein